MLIKKKIFIFIVVLFFAKSIFTINNSDLGAIRNSIVAINTNNGKYAEGSTTGGLTIGLGNLANKNKYSFSVLYRGKIETNFHNFIYLGSVSKLELIRFVNNINSLFNFLVKENYIIRYADEKLSYKFLLEGLAFIINYLNKDNIANFIESNDLDFDNLSEFYNTLNSLKIFILNYFRAFEVEISQNEEAIFDANIFIGKVLLSDLIFRLQSKITKVILLKKEDSSFISQKIEDFKLTHEPMMQQIIVDLPDNVGLVEEIRFPKVDNQNKVDSKNVDENNVDKNNVKSFKEYGENIEKKIKNTENLVNEELLNEFKAFWENMYSADNEISSENIIPINTENENNIIEESGLKSEIGPDILRFIKNWHRKIFYEGADIKDEEAFELYNYLIENKKLGLLKDIKDIEGNLIDFEIFESWLNERLDI